MYVYPISFKSIEFGDSKLNCIEDDEEHFKDVHDPNSDVDESTEITTNTVTKEKKSSWVHRNNTQGHICFI